MLNAIHLCDVPRRCRPLLWIPAFVFLALLLSATEPARAAQTGPKIALVLDAGIKELSSVIEVEKNGVVGTLPVLKRKGYKFLGWFTKKSKGMKVKQDTMVSSLEQMKLFAHWQKISYRIIYRYNHGVLTLPQMMKGVNPTKYTVEDEITPAAPYREKFRFMGWYSSADFNKNTRVKKIPKGTTGTITLYAYFAPYDGYIHFDSNGVLDDFPADYNCMKGKTYVLPGADDPLLGSWNTKPDLTGKFYYPGQKVKDLVTNGRILTLYADPFSPGNNIAKITRYFVRIGYSKEAAAAIAGNLMFESGGGASDIKLNAVEYSTGRGIGMVQWTNTVDGPRRTAFEKFCASQGKPWPNKDLKVQVDFLIRELNGKYGPIWKFLPRMGYPSDYKMTLKQFKKLRDLSKAVGVFCACFERPYMRDAHLATRTMYARIAYKYVN